MEQTQIICSIIYLMVCFIAIDWMLIMSIYSCADEVKLTLKNGVHQPHTGVMNFLLQIIPPLRWITPDPVRPLHDDERLFLENVRARLKEIGKDGYKDSKKEELGELIKQINAYSIHHNDTNSHLNTLLNYLKEDLSIVKDGRKPLKHSDAPTPLSETNRTQLLPSPAVNEQYQALLNSRLLMNKLVQGSMKELGTSRGDCYGFTMSMADSDLSPYKNKGKEQIEYNKAIYKYQKNQLDREKDQKKIKSTRLTMKTFCPSLKEQAEELYKIASEHVGEDLSITLRSKLGGHATYLSIQDDQKIRYADSNHGVFLFDNKEQFISAYKLMYQYHNQQKPAGAYNFFSVSQLKEDKNNELTESNTLAGKWRSLMTGKKYHSDTATPDPDRVIPALIGGLAGAVAGAAIGSAIPIIGTLIGGIVGALIGSTAAVGAVTLAHKNGHYGLLGPYHFMREKLHDFSESVKEQLGVQRECDETPEMVLPETGSSSIMFQALCKVNTDSPNNTNQALIAENTDSISEQNIDIQSQEEPEIIVNEEEQDYVSYSPK